MQPASCQVRAATARGAGGGGRRHSTQQQSVIEPFTQGGGGAVAHDDVTKPTHTSKQKQRNKQATAQNRPLRLLRHTRAVTRTKRAVKHGSGCKQACVTTSRCLGGDVAGKTIAHSRQAARRRHVASHNTIKAEHSAVREGNGLVGHTHCTKAGLGNRWGAHDNTQRP